MVWIARQLATVFGLGYVPKASGTWGSLAAIPLVIVLYQLGPMEYLIGCTVVCVIGLLVSGLYCSSSEMGDPQEIIIDEVAGYIISMAWLPITYSYLIGTFLVFRVLDILKPPPISFFDRRVKGGVGVMADDIVAGILTNVLFQWIYQSGALQGWI